MSDNEYKKRILKTVVCFATIALFILGFDKVSFVLTTITNVTLPFIIGGIIAFAINMPVRFFENKVFKFKTKFGLKIKRPISIIISFLILILVISVIVIIVVPQISKTITDATNSIPEFVRNTATIIQEKFELKGEWQKEIQAIKDASDSWKTLVEYISRYLPTDMFKSVNMVYSFIEGVFSSFLTGIISIVFCVYSIILEFRIPHAISEFGTLCKFGEFLKSRSSKQYCGCS